MRGGISPPASFPDHSKLTLQFFPVPVTLFQQHVCLLLNNGSKGFFTVSVHKKDLQ